MFVCVSRVLSAKYQLNMVRPVILSASVWLLLIATSNVSAGRLPQRYLPSQQYLAPQAQPSQLHYHGVSGAQSHARIGGIGGAGGVAGGFGGGHRSQPQIPIVRSDYQSDASGNYNFG